MDKIDDGTLKDCSVVTVVSSNSKAYAIQRAKKAIPVEVISRKSFEDSAHYDRALINHMKSMMYS